MVAGTLVCAVCRTAKGAPVSWDDHAPRDGCSPIVNPSHRFGSPLAVVQPFVEAFGPVSFDPCGDPGSEVASDHTIYLPEHAPELRELAGGMLAGEWADYGVEFGDGLALPWSSAGFTWVNPPYGRRVSELWARRVAEAGAFAEHLVALVKVSTGSAWWAPHWTARRVCFVAGRIAHTGGDGKGRFDSALCYWGVAPETFERIASEMGRVVAP
jgi:DNA N-6-adenine-methyltransferase (Dam)